MSLYGNFTLKEWLSLNCSKKDVNDIFRKALKDNDEPLAVLALAELIKRDEIYLVTNTISEATDAGCFGFRTHFVTVFTNALTQLGERNPVLRVISKNVRKKGFWPATSAELLYDAHAETLLKRDDADFASIEHSAAQNFNVILENRLGEFLKGFLKLDGFFEVKFGTSIYDEEFFITNHSTVSLVIENHSILNAEMIPVVLELLDDFGLGKPLPEFHGEEGKSYSLNGYGEWIDVASIEDGEDYFYVTYRFIR